PHGRLRYLPSGRVPHLVVGSRRGVPYRSKPEGGRTVRTFLPTWASDDWFAALEERTDVDFADAEWPEITSACCRVYLAALTELGPAAGRGDWLSGLDAAGTAEEVDAVLDDAITAPRWTWTLEELHRPTRGEAVSPQTWAGLVQRLIADELG